MNRPVHVLSIVVGAALLIVAAPVLASAQARQSTPPAQGVATPSPTPTAQTQGRGRGSQGPRDRQPWWQDEAIKKEIGLRDDQSRRLAALYDNRSKEIEPLNAELRKQRDQLDKLIGDRAVSRAAIELQVALMEAPRSKMNESFFVMIHRMYLVLDAEQYKKLQAIFERDNAGGRGRGGSF